MVAVWNARHSVEANAVCLLSASQATDLTLGLAGRILDSSRLLPSYGDSSREALERLLALVGSLSPLPLRSKGPAARERFKAGLAAEWFNPQQRTGGYFPHCCFITEKSKMSDNQT